MNNNPLHTIKSFIVRKLKSRHAFLCTLTEDAFAYPPDARLGDISLPCFNFIKQTGKNPAEIASEIADAWNANASALKYVHKARCAGPYVNFILAPQMLARMLFNALKQPRLFGNNTTGKGERVMIEYPSPNTHKEFHIGHVRNVCLGVSLVKIYEANGFKVVPVDYTNDLGAHVAKCLWALRKFHAGEHPPRGSEARWLGTIYAEGSRKADERPEYAGEISAVLQELEARGKQAFALWKKTRAWSINGMNVYLKELGAYFKRDFFESEVKDEGKRIVSELLRKGVAKKSQGAVIIDMEAKGLGVMLLIKSDGTGLYATSDLALARKKFALFRIDRSINITDVRQSLYFKQLFYALKLSGFNQKMSHIGYEFVRLPEGAMASREGRVVLYEDMRDEMIAAASKETCLRHPKWGTRKVGRAARTIALAALKFGMLKCDPGKVIVFDKQEAIRFEGFTGPYLLYTLARIESLFKKSSAGVCGRRFARGAKKTSKYLADSHEKQLILHCLRLHDVVKSAGEFNNPSELAQYAYKLCQLFSEFYEACPVIRAESEETKLSRLALVSAVRAVLIRSLELLGILTLKEM